MSIASREAKWEIRATVCGLHASLLLQNRCAPRCSSGNPHAGHCSGKTISSPSLSSVTLPRISGMTSLERRIKTRVPRANFRFCAQYRRHCSEYSSVRVTPASSTGSTRASGVTLPVRPTFHTTALRTVVVSSASNLYATAQRGLIGITQHFAGAHVRNFDNSSIDQIV